MAKLISSKWLKAMAQIIDPERIESIKAGGIAALTGMGVGALLVGMEIGLNKDGYWADPSIATVSILRVVVSTICSFLFGVTYRYIVRQDQNPHLRSGAVGAFALTRSLSQLERVDLPHLSSIASVSTLILPIIESFGLFLAIRLVLDLGLQQCWLHPFPITKKN